MKGRGLEERLGVMRQTAPASPQVVLVMGSLGRGTGFLPCNNICVERKPRFC
jgi:hypothetical protein